jgi:hypothetical protein
LRTRNERAASKQAGRDDAPPEFILLQASNSSALRLAVRTRGGNDLR